MKIEIKSTHLGIAIIVLLVVIGGYVYKQDKEEEERNTEQALRIITQIDSNYHTLPDHDERVTSYRTTQDACNDYLKQNVNKKDVNQACDYAYNMKEADIKKDYSETFNGVKVPKSETTKDYIKNAEDKTYSVELLVELADNIASEDILDEKEQKEYKKKIDEKIHGLTVLNAIYVNEYEARECSKKGEFRRKDFDLSLCNDPKEYTKSTPDDSETSYYDISLLTKDDVELIEGDITAYIQTELEKKHKEETEWTETMTEDEAEDEGIFEDEMDDEEYYDEFVY